MIFTHVCRLVAILALLLGVLTALLGLGIAAGYIGPYEAAMARFARWASSSGQVVDSGLYTILLAIGLGTLAEIGLSVRKRAKD